MADNAAETALRYLRDPTVVAGLGAVAVGSMYYLASRPTPQPCPVDPDKQSYELPASIPNRLCDSHCYFSFLSFSEAF